MADLTKAQAELLKRLWVQPVRLYGPEWKCFYHLKAKGLAQYMVDADGQRNYAYAIITDAGKALI